MIAKADMSPGLQQCMNIWNQYFVRPVSAKPDPIVSQWINAGELSVLAGNPNAGKSLTVYDLAVSVATGTPWGGVVPTSRRPVIYLDFENPTHYGEDMLQRAVAYKVADPMGLLLPIGKEQLTGGFNAEHVTQAITIHSVHCNFPRPGLLIVDTARSAFGPQFATECPEWENKSGLVQRAIRELRNVCEETGWAVLFIHHTNKGGRSPSGSNQWTSDPDHHLLLERSGKGPAKLSYVSGRNLDPPAMPIELRKARYWITGEKSNTTATRSTRADPVDRAVLKYITSAKEATERELRLNTYKTRTLKADVVKASVSRLIASGSIVSVIGKRRGNQTTLYRPV